MPESVKDRCTKSHEYIFLLAKSQKYYYDSEAIKEPATGRIESRFRNSARYTNHQSFTNGSTRYGGNKYTENPSVFYRTKSGNIYEPKQMRNKRSVWDVNTRGYDGAHFATFPKDLIRPCIRAGSRYGGIVLDPFFGSGTTGIVALEEGRKCIGIELNPEYVTLAQNRIDKASEQMRLPMELC